MFSRTCSSSYMGAGAIWFAVLKVKSPHTLASIQHDMEG